MGSLARSNDLDEERIDDIRIAVSEACTNAVFTNEESGGEGTVTVGWVRHDDRIEVEVGDGTTLAEELPDVSDSQGFSTRLVMSMALLRELADDLDVETRRDGGTLVRLTFRLDGVPAH